LGFWMFSPLIQPSKKERRKASEVSKAEEKRRREKRDARQEREIELTFVLLQRIDLLLSPRPRTHRKKTGLSKIEGKGREMGSRKPTELSSSS